MTTTFERAVAIALARTMLGFVYFFAGVRGLLEPGPSDFGPLVAASAPFLEFALGALVLTGLWSRVALRCLAALIVLVTLAYGVRGVLDPMGMLAIDARVVNFYILPRAALIIVTLFLPAEDDLLTVDALRAGRARRLFRTC